MSIDTTQFTEYVQQGRDAVRQAVETWTQTVTTAIGPFPAVAPSVDAEAVIDRYFDLNEKLLAAQRDFAKNMVGYATAAGAAVREHVESVVPEYATV